MLRTKPIVMAAAMLIAGMSGANQQAKADDLAALGTLGYEWGGGIFALGVVQNVGNTVYFSQEDRWVRCWTYFPPNPGSPPNTGTLLKVFDVPLPTMYPGAQYWPYGQVFPPSFQPPLVFLEIYDGPNAPQPPADPNPSNNGTFNAQWGL